MEVRVTGELSHYEYFILLHMSTLRIFCRRNCEVLKGTSLSDMCIVCTNKWHNIYDTVMVLSQSFNYEYALFVS
jgi:hypothetical protein